LISVLLNGLLFLGELLGLSLLKLGNTGIGFGAEQTTTPVTTDLFEAVIVVVLDGLNQFGEVQLVTRVNLGEGNAGAGLAADQTTKTGLVLDDAIGDSHLTAESGQEDDQLNWVNIVGDDNQLSFLLFDQGGDSVDSLSDNVWALGGGISLSASTELSAGTQTHLLGLFAFGAVLVHQLEHLSRCLAVQGLTELVHWRGDLKTFHKNGLVALETDVLGPSYKAAQISLGLDILTNSVVTGLLLNQGVDHLLGGLFLDGKWGGGHTFANSALSSLDFLQNHFYLKMHD